MEPKKKPKVTVVISSPIPLDILKKYGSNKPIRRPKPRDDKDKDKDS